MLSIVLAGLVFSPFAGSSGIATYASIRGVVTTGWPSYKPVANAQVVVSGDADRRETRSDANGRYTFLTLLPGTYRVYVPSVKGLVRLTGSAGVSEQGKGTGWVTRKPERSRSRPYAKPAREHRPEQRSRPDERLGEHRERTPRTRSTKACGIPRRSHKRTDLRGGKS